MYIAILYKNGIFRNIELASDGYLLHQLENNKRISILEELADINAIPFEDQEHAEKLMYKYTGFENIGGIKMPVNYHVWKESLKHCSKVISFFELEEKDECIFKIIRKATPLARGNKYKREGSDKLYDAELINNRYYAIDFVVRMLPTKPEEIDLKKIKQFLYENTPSGSQFIVLIFEDTEAPGEPGISMCSSTTLSFSEVRDHLSNLLAEMQINPQRFK